MNRILMSLLMDLIRKTKRITSLQFVMHDNFILLESNPKKMVKMAFQNEKKTLNLKKEKKSEVGSTADHHLCVCLSAAHKNRLQCET